MTRSGVLAVLAVAVGLGCGEMPPVNDGGSSTGGGRTDAGSGGGRTGGGSAGGGTNTGGGGGGEVGGGEGGGAGGGGTTTECTPDATRACCTTGMQTCDGSGRWGACSITGTIEVCNGVDDDCDGQVDENIAFTPGELADAGALPDGGCEVGVGACLRNGGLTCNASGAAACNVTAGTPGTESCNGVDDDCDGQVDE
ncbi:MAG: MopE-related protein, partial [Archangium sp.]